MSIENSISTLPHSSGVPCVLKGYAIRHISDFHPLTSLTFSVKPTIENINNLLAFLNILRYN